MRKEELDNMWAETQLNADAANFRGKAYITVCWTIEDNGLAIIMDVTETSSASEALDEYFANCSAMRNMCKSYTFKRPVTQMCSAYATYRNGCYMLIEQCTCEVKTYNPKNYK